MLRNAGRVKRRRHPAGKAAKAFVLLRGRFLFADQTNLQVSRLMQRVHYLHHGFIIDGFIRAEEDGGVFLAAGQLVQRRNNRGIRYRIVAQNMDLSAFTDR